MFNLLSGKTGQLQDVRNRVEMALEHHRQNERSHLHLQHVAEL